MKKYYLTIVCVMLLSTVSFASWSGATADQYISSLGTTNSKVYAPSFAAGQNGKLYAVWVQGTYSNPYEIYFSKSVDAGSTWTGSSGDMMISANDGDKVYNLGIFGSRRIDIAIDNDERIFVVWPENYVSANFDTTVEIMMVMSTDGGNNWLHSDIDFPISDTLSSNPATDPVIKIDSDNNIHVIWGQNELSTNVFEVHYSTSTDNGATWSGRSGDRNITQANGTSSGYPGIAIDNDDNIHIVYREYYSSTDHRLLYGVSADGGTTFTSETTDSILSYAPKSFKYPRITTGTSPGNVHIIYAQNDTAMYVGTTNGGTSWTETLIWGGESYDMYTPEIAVNSTGYLVVLLDEQPSGTTNRQIFASYSFDDGLTWSSVLDPVTHYDASATYDRCYIPTIALTPGDILNVAYATNFPSSSNSYQEMCFSRSDTLETPTGITENRPIPQQFALLQNYPNPFNASTSIAYTLSEPQFVTLKVYDLIGREIKTLVEEHKQAGNHSIDFNALGFSSGVYFYRLQAGNQAESMRMILLK